MTEGNAGDVVERFLRCMTGHDWDGLDACLADEFTRVGPYGDTYTTKAAYRTFISELLPGLPGYAMEIGRVTYCARIAFAELSETVTVDGRPLRTPECLVFELTTDDRIARVEVFIQTVPPAP